MKNNKLVLLRGIVGAGKSTKAINEYVPLGYKHLETDMFFIDGKGNYKFTPREIKVAHQWCQDSTRTALMSGFNVIVSNTFTQLWEMDYYINLAKSLNIPFEVIECTGNYNNVHGVPDEIVQKMKDRWEVYPPILVNS